MAKRHAHVSQEHKLSVVARIAAVTLVEDNMHRNILIPDSPKSLKPTEPTLLGTLWVQLGHNDLRRKTKSSQWSAKVQ